MLSRWLSRITFASALVGVTLLASPSLAQADSSITINGGNVPTTASDYDHECSANQGGGPYANQDVWVFVLPGNHADSGDFVSVTASFDTGDDGIADTVVHIDAD